MAFEKFQFVIGLGHLLVIEFYLSRADFHVAELGMTHGDLLVGVVNLTSCCFPVANVADL